nr:winged helix-turn-helix domain-containing protein [Aeromonas veronii]
MMSSQACDWGPINPAWIKAQLPLIKETLSYP